MNFGHLFGIEGVKDIFAVSFSVFHPPVWVDGFVWDEWVFGEWSFRGLSGLGGVFCGEMLLGCVVGW